MDDLDTYILLYVKPQTVECVMVCNIKAFKMLILILNG